MSWVLNPFTGKFDYTASNATTTNKGIASFNTNDFVVASGVVSANGNGIYARVKRTTDQTINTGFWTHILFNSETDRWDTDGMHSTSSNTGRLTAVTAGWYVIGATYQFVANSTGARGGSLVLNGTWDASDHYASGTFLTGFFQNSVGAVLPTPILLSTQWYLNVGDYVEATAYQNTVGDLAVYGGLDAYSAEFYCCKIY